MSKKTYSFKAGILNFDVKSKKVTADKRKGELSIQYYSEDEIQVVWKDLETQENEFDRIIFAFDAKFIKYEKMKRVCLLKSEEEFHFFWIQETDASQDDNHIKQFNEVLYYEEGIQEEVQQPQTQQQTQQQQQQPQQSLNNVNLLDPNFLQNLQNQVQQSRQQTPSILKVLNKEFILELLSDEESANELLQYLPEGQQTLNDLQQNLQSPQYQQGVDQLEQALNSEQGGMILQQLQLDPTQFGYTFDGIGTLYKELIKKYKK